MWVDIVLVHLGQVEGAIGVSLRERLTILAWYEHIKADLAQKCVPSDLLGLQTIYLWITLVIACRFVLILFIIIIWDRYFRLAISPRRHDVQLKATASLTMTELVAWRYFLTRHGRRPANHLQLARADLIEILWVTLRWSLLSVEWIGGAFQRVSFIH